MAIVKVKLRFSKVEGKTGVIYYQISHNRKIRHITTNLHVFPEDWDSNAEMVKIETPNFLTIQQRVTEDILNIWRIIDDFEEKGEEYSVLDIVERFSTPKLLLIDYISAQIDILRTMNRMGTALAYEKVKHSFSQFLGDKKMPLSEISEQIIIEYNAFLIQRGLVRNSISFYMRILRAVYNKAVQQQLVIQKYPFKGVYTGVDNTRKRAVSEATIVKIHKIDLPIGTPIAFARDLFIFSYCTRGMAFVDIAFLKKSNIQNGNICYARRKTGKLLTIKIEPSIQRIIDRYATSNTLYVFPIITSADVVVAYNQYHMALNTYNRWLRNLSEIVGSESKLTSYTSRHSWATVARNHNVPISVISAGMGHASEQTTQIYLTMLENSVIDQANKRIINSIS